jgi:hypothetical protein
MIMWVGMVQLGLGAPAHAWSILNTSFIIDIIRVIIFLFSLVFNYKNN